MKSCEGCIWNSDCGTDEACEFYDAIDNDTEYHWAEMSYNNADDTTVCTVVNMKDWYKKLEKLN